MSRRAVGKSAIRFLFLVLLLGSGPVVAGEGDWGLGAGLSMFGSYGSTSRYEGFGNLAAPHLAVERRLHRPLWLRAEGEFQSFRSGDGLRSRRVDWIPLAVGLRLQGIAPLGVGGYLELAPTLFGFHWTGDLYGGTGSDELRPLSIQDWRRVVPGVTAGLGLRLRGHETLAVSYGLRYRRSSRPVPELEPLEQWTFVLGADWRPSARR